MIFPNEVWIKPVHLKEDVLVQLENDSLLVHVQQGHDLAETSKQIRKNKLKTPWQ